MKNIHVIPTDKPSMWYLDENKKLQYIPAVQYNCNNCVNIYITSDEEIEENYVLSHGVIIKVMMFDNETLYFINGTKAKREDCKKITLTTDSELIKDGVQAIDDEFLEWFINNPNCEEVEIEDLTDYNYQPDYKCYGIIIPKEEPEQDFYKIGNFHELCDDSCKYHCTKGNTQIADCLKQETLEEFAKNYKLKIIPSVYHAVIAGAKWQQERMYSEEEVFELLENLVETFNPPTDNLKEWFKEYKKK